MTRQVLAEPSADLYDKSWANLADGTPLVTGEARQRGQLVLFHVTPEATWSNLPISGSFVDMLHRIISLSNSSGPTANDTRESGSAALPPHLTLSAEGTLVPPNGDTKPLLIRSGTSPEVSFDNPPGFYGVEDAMVAFNLFKPDGEIKPLIRPDLTIPVMTARYAVDESRAASWAALCSRIIASLPRMPSPSCGLVVICASALSPDSNRSVLGNPHAGSCWRLRSLARPRTAKRQQTR